VPLAYDRVIHSLKERFAAERFEARGAADFGFETRFDGIRERDVDARFGVGAGS
jgi:hypothetical protein